MSEKQKKRRTITAVREWKIVTEAADKHGVTGDSTVYDLVEKLRDAALAEVASQ